METRQERSTTLAPENTQLHLSEIDPDMASIQERIRFLESQRISAQAEMPTPRNYSTPRMELPREIDSLQEEREFARAFPPQQNPDFFTSGRADNPPRGAEPMNTTERMLQAFTSSITGLLNRFTEVSRQPKWSSSHVDTYEGRVDEDPERFVDIIDHHINKLELTEDIDKINLFRGQLKGEARKWADSIRNAPVSYFTFIRRFLDEFNSPRRQVIAYHKLYAEFQKPSETAEEFISFKQALLARLRPNMSNETTIEMVISLLKPALSSRIIGTRPTSLEELIKNVRLIEHEVEREYKTLQPRQTSTGQNNQTTLRNNNPSNTTYTPPTPPTPCRWCGEWHYSFKCPVNPYNQHQQQQIQPSTSRPRSGNVRPAEGATRQSNAQATTATKASTTSQAAPGRRQMQTNNRNTIQNTQTTKNNIPQTSQPSTSAGPSAVADH